MQLNRRNALAAGAALGIVTAASSLKGDDPALKASWPRWLGPEGTNRVDAALPIEWSDSKNVLWRVPIAGRGWSSPVVGDGLVWLTTAPENGGVFVVLAHDIKSGRQVKRVDLWPKTTVHPINALNSYASPSPTLAGGKVYVHFGRYGTACIEASTGAVVWQRNDLPLDHSEGPGSSPVLWKDLLIIPCDGKDVQYVTALNAATGETVWKTDRSVDLSVYDPEMRKAFASPAVFDIGGQPTLISQGAQAVYAYDPATGKEWWKVEHPQGFSTICVPQKRDNMLVVATGYMKPQLWGIKLSGSGPDTKTEVVWRHTSNCPNMPSPVIHNGMVFSISDNGGIASCLDLATGKVNWTQRIGGNYSATPLIANGKLYLFQRDDLTIVVKASGKYEKLAENTLLGNGCMATPAVAGESLILRTPTMLYRIEEL